MPVTIPTVSPINTPATTNPATRTGGGAVSGNAAGNAKVHGRPSNQPSAFATTHRPGRATRCRNTRACALPIDYVTVLKSGQLQAVIDPQNNDLWRTSEESNEEPA